MAQTAHTPSSGGRPRRHEMSPAELLDHYVEYSRDTRRGKGPAAISRGGFAEHIDKNQVTLRKYIEDFNFPWPLLEPGDMVCLLDDAPPHELWWVSDAWTDFCGRRRDEVLWKSASYLRGIGFADGAHDEQLALTRRLRQGPERVGMSVGWVQDAAGECQHVNYEFRYSSYSTMLYIRATPVEPTNHNHVEVFNVVPNLILRQRTGDSVDLVDMEHLIQQYMETMPKYEYGGSQQSYLDNAIDAERPD